MSGGLTPTTPMSAGGSSGDVQMKLRKDHSMVFKIAEGKNFPTDGENAHCVIRIDDDMSSQIKTKTVWRNRSPFWDEEYEFPLPDSFKQIVVEVWSKNKFTRDDLIGSFTVTKLSLIGRSDARSIEQWYPVLPPAKGTAISADADKEKSERKPHEFKGQTFKSPTTCDHCAKVIWGSAGLRCESCNFNCHAKCESLAKTGCGTMGAVRVRVKYTNDYMLPLPSYARLLEFFYDDKLQAITAFGSVTDEREDVAKSLVRIAEYTNIPVKFLSILNAVEVASCPDPNTLFRANSLASKGVDYYMKLIAMPYLHAVLKPVMDDIINKNHPIELDPTRLEKGDDAEANRVVLQAYIEWTSKRIFGTVYTFWDVVKKWPDNEQTQFICVSGYIFLRFFNAAILGPKLFGLCSEHPNQRVSRMLTLISKTIQNLANLVQFDGRKEPFMVVLNDFIVANIPAMKQFIKKIASPPDEKEMSQYKEKLSRAGSVLKKRDKKAKGPEEGKPVIDIELELAAMHRFFMRGQKALKAWNETNNNVRVESLLGVLDDMGADYQKRLKAALDEQRAEIEKALIEDGNDTVDFLEFLEQMNQAPGSRRASELPPMLVGLGSVRPSAGPMSPMSPGGMPLPSVDLSALRFNLGDGGPKLTLVDMFEFLDPNSSGQLARSDLELMLASLGLDMSQDIVHRALLKTKIPANLSMIPKRQVEELFGTLIPALSKALADPTAVAQASALITSHFGSKDGTLTAEQAKLICSTGRSRLNDAELALLPELVGTGVKLAEYLTGA